MSKQMKNSYSNLSNASMAEPSPPWGGVALAPTESGNHFTGDPNQLVFKTSSLALLRAKSQKQRGVPEKQLPADQNYVAGAKRVMDFMFNLWQQGRLCDVTLTSSENEVFWAHKIAIGAHSSYLAKKFFSQPSGTICHINLSRFSSLVLRAILRFIYTTDLVLTDGNIDSILDCALEMGLDMLAMACKDHLGSCTVDTALSFLHIAEKYDLRDLKTSILSFITNNLAAICETGHFLELDFTFIKKIVVDDKLGLGNELDIFLAVVAWIEYDRSERLQYAPELIGYVRMQLIKPELLVTHVETVEFIFCIPQCHDQLYNAFKYHALQLSGSPLIKSFPIQLPRVQKLSSQSSIGNAPRYKEQISVFIDGGVPQTNEHVWDINLDQSNSHPQVSPPGVKQGTNSLQSFSNPTKPTPILAVAVGGIDLQSMASETPGKAVFCYNQNNKSWEQLAKMSYSMHHHGVISIGTSVYVIGGALFDSKKPDDIGGATNMVHAYDLFTAQWRRLSDMRESRAYHAVAHQHHSRFIYAIGGEDENKRHLDSIEKYDVNADQWTMLARMPKGPKIGLSAAVLEDELYIVGGYNKTRPGSHVLDDVECFDLSKLKWKAKRPLQQPRCHANLVNALGRLYLIVGRTKLDGPPATITSLSSILIYDPATDQWVPVGDLRFARHDAGCVAVGTKIYVVGGMMTPSPYCLSSVECFDVTTGKWEEDRLNLPYNASGVACCALETAF